MLFAVLYWLNPWRLYFSAFLWNPNWLFLPAAVHLWSAWRAARAGALRRLVRCTSWRSASAFQLHASFVLLAFASALLLWRRRMRLHWPARRLAALVSAAALVPWALAGQRRRRQPAGAEGLPRARAAAVQPLLKGLLYWPRYASLSLAKRDDGLRLRAGARRGRGRLARSAGRRADAPAGATLRRPLLAAGCSATRGSGARPRRGGLRRLARRPASAPRGWIASYAGCCLGAAVVAFALAPTTIMMWQGFLVLHAAVLPVVLWGEALARSRRARAAVAGAWAWAAVSAVWLLLMAAGSPHYRCGGERPLQLDLRHDHPMLHELGIHRSCPLPIRPDAWWPDVLPEPGGQVRGAGRTVRGKGGLPP